MIQENQIKALDKLLSTSPVDAAQFAMGTQAVRAAICANHPDVLIFPERGSVPIYWASEGLSDFDSGYSSRVVKPRIGTYGMLGDNMRITGQSGLNKPQKEYLLRQSLADFEGGGYRFTLVDEVQHGGTIYTAIRYLKEIIPDSSKHLCVVAAQDSSRDRTNNMVSGYRRLTANRDLRVNTVTVCPMPLIATDRDVLLNQLVRTDGAKESACVVMEVRDNECSEQIFRLMGSVAAHSLDTEISEALHNLLQDIGDTQTGKEQEISRWMNGFVRSIQSTTDG